METKELKAPWRDTSLFQNLREVTEEGYKQMLEYEAAGGELDVLDKSAKKYFEKYWHRRKNKEKKQRISEVDIDGDVEQETSWED